MQNPDKIPLFNKLNSQNEFTLWNEKELLNFYNLSNKPSNFKKIQRFIKKIKFYNEVLSLKNLKDRLNKNFILNIAQKLISEVQSKRGKFLFISIYKYEKNQIVFFQDAKGKRDWFFKEDSWSQEKFIIESLKVLIKKEKKKILLIPDQTIINYFYKNGIAKFLLLQRQLYVNIFSIINETKYFQSKKKNYDFAKTNKSYLNQLEAESIHIIREVVAENENPVMLYSLGKDSSVLMHLAKKAFYPNNPPFPFLHIDTGWKFREMYNYRNQILKKYKLELIIYKNQDGIEKNINPFDHGSSIHTNIMKTEALKKALNKGNFDAAFGGARRDEEKVRAKERIFSLRNESHTWNPKTQRAEFWNTYNTQVNVGESLRVFPLSNWTEIDIWEYIYSEDIEIVSLYFAKKRPFLKRNNNLIMIDDDRILINKKENIFFDNIRFRTLGCYPLSGAIYSNASDVKSIISELYNSKYSEREGRLIDNDSSYSMEKKKIEGYF